MLHPNASAQAIALEIITPEAAIRSNKVTAHDAVIRPLPLLSINQAFDNGLIPLDTLKDYPAKQVRLCLTVSSCLLWHCIFPHASHPKKMRSGQQRCYCMQP